MREWGLLVQVSGTLGQGGEVAGLQQPVTEKGAAGSRWSRGQSATGCSCRGWGGGSGWREAAEAALTCPPSPPARLIQHTKDLMVSEEKLCVKVLRTLQQMLLKKTKYGDRVSWPWTKTARQSQPPSWPGRLDSRRAWPGAPGAEDQDC